MNIFNLKILSSCIVCSFLCVNTAHAQFKAHRLDSLTDAIQLDGKLDEEIWQKASVVDKFYQTQPFDKVEAHLRTEVRIAYDGRYLYVGIKAFDTNPELIRGPFARRDKIGSDQDYLGLLIDPSSGHKSAQVFYVNARGALMDGNYSDMTGDDTAPDYDYAVATTRFDGGWTAEMRIPFSSIAYDKTSTTPWSLLVMRNMTRDHRYRMYSGAVTRATSCNLCFSGSIEGLTELPSGVSWNATPQLVTRRTRDEVERLPRQNSSSTDISLDMKFRPNSATTIDATINPDFSQIELDAPQLSGNTRFSIFVQEKRPFFLEGADILRTPFSVISTRSISNPDVGLRYTRRDADKDFTVLTSRDAAGGLVLLPNSYYTAYATRTVPSIATDARANFRFGALSVGAVLTDRTLLDGRGYNRVVGPDFLWQRSQNEKLRGQFLMSSTTAQPDSNGNLVRGILKSGHAANLDWYRGDDFWSTSINYREISPDFRADNGFFSQVGFRSVNTDVTKKLPRMGSITEFNVYIQGEYKLDSKNNIMSKILTPGVRVAGPLDSNAYLTVSPRGRSRVNNNGELFSTSRRSFGMGFSPSKEIARVGLDASIGEVIDIESNRVGHGGSLTMSAKLRPSDRFELEPSFATSWINSSVPASQGERAYTEQAIQVNGIAHITSKDSIRMILQEAHTTRNPSLYLKKVATESQRRVGSFVYAHSASLGTATFVGVTISQSDTPGFSPKRKQSELFAKFSWQL